jgi:hypothetical protein
VVRGPKSRRSIGAHVGGIHFDAHGLADQLHGKHEPRARSLSYQAADDTLQRPVHDFHPLPLAQQGTGIVLQIALNQRADSVNLVFGNRRDFAVERDDGDDAGALQDRQFLGSRELREAVSGKQRPVDSLLAIVGRNTGKPRPEMCSETTCSWRDRVQTAYQRAFAVATSRPSSPKRPARRARRPNSSRARSAVPRLFSIPRSSTR